MPEIKHAQDPYTIDTEIYYPDFEGNSNDGSKWVIEVRGAYMRAGGIPILVRLHTIQSRSLKVKTWLIVTGEASKVMKDFAARYQIYLSDIVSWQEIKSLLK